MLYLGISEDLFDSGVTLCDGEKILFASNEERYSRRKNEGGFPEKSLEALLQRTGVAPEAIDVICFSGIMTPPLPVRIFPSLHKRAFDAKRHKRTSPLRSLIDAVTFLTPMSPTSQKSLSRSVVKRLLPHVMRFMLPGGFRKATLRFVDHHQAHAAVAYALSGFERALVVTADGMGDGLSLTVSSYASPDQHERLNNLLSRSDFMPFAPAMLDEEVERYLLHYNAGLHAAEFMTVCFDCTEERQREHAAVVHVDKTARAQLVREATNRAFYRILKAYREITGNGVLLNTSFNIHEEPIVCTPDEAVSTFLRGKLDCLALGPYFVKQPDEAI